MGSHVGRQQPTHSIESGNGNRQSIEDRQVRAGIPGYRWPEKGGRHDAAVQGDRPERDGQAQRSPVAVAGEDGDVLT
jgi:hypothetical protein